MVELYESYFEKSKSKGFTSNHENNVVCKIMDAFHNNQSEVFLEQEFEDSINLK